MDRLLLTSDPLITVVRCNTNKKRKSLSSEFKVLSESDRINVNILEACDCDETDERKFLFISKTLFYTFYTENQIKKHICIVFRGIK